MSENTRNDNPNESSGGTVRHWERETLERLVFATVREQRAARRWGIFFKLSFLLLAFFAIWAYFDFNFSGYRFPGPPYRPHRNQRHHRR
jgi:protease-4